jgi:CheY-like chemotaxis protein
MFHRQSGSDKDEVRRKTFRLEEPDLSDSALQAQILQRCRRSIDHDIKNAVQALHSGVEVLSRTLQSPANRKISPLECIPLLQHQLANLRAKLSSLLDEVAPEPAAPAAFDLVELLRDLLRFLNHEKAATQAQLQLPPHAWVLARKSVLRRVLLGCLLDAIDSMDSAGSLQFVITQADSRVTLQFQVTDGAKAVLDASPAHQRLRQILERTMGNEGLPIAFATADRDYTVKMLLPAEVVADTTVTSVPTAPLKTTDAEAAAQSGALRILIVDDNRDAADSLALLLELEGHGTKSVYTGEQALAAIDEYQPRLVLLDIGLPDMTGDVVAQRIRASSRSKPLLVSISGYDRGARRSAAAPFSFDAELVKPVELPDLRKLLATLLR